jgi:hypothetical protein
VSLKITTIESLLRYAVWTYSTGLELNSPRFGQPGDFFTYVTFVASVILVSTALANDFQLSILAFPTPRISARPAQF